MPGSKRARPRGCQKVQPMFQGGQAVSRGTYVSLEDGHFVRVWTDGRLPRCHGLPLYYVRLSDSPEYLVEVSLLSDAA